MRCVAVRCGAVQCGVVQCGAVRCGAVRCGAVRCGAVRCGAVRCGAVRCGAVRCGAVRCGAVRCGAVRCCAVWCGGYITFQREFPRRTLGPAALRGNNNYIKVFLIVLSLSQMFFLVYIESIYQRSESLSNLIKNIPVSPTFLKKYCIVLHGICTVLHCSVA